VQRGFRQRPGALDGPGPQPLDRGPSLAEPVRVGRSHLHQVGLAALELGLDQRRDVHAVDGEALDLPVDPGVEEPHAAHHDVLEPGLAEPRTGQVDVVEVGLVEVDLVEPGPLQVDLLEAGVGKVLLVEVGHVDER
jgi:hypothetical protein